MVSKRYRSLAGLNPDGYNLTVAVFQFVSTVVNQPESSSPATVTIGFAPDSKTLATPVSITVFSLFSGSASCMIDKSKKGCENLYIYKLC